MVGVLASVVLLAGVPNVAGAATLAQRVTKLEAKMNCLVRYGLSEWSGYAPYIGGDGSFAYDPGADAPAANFDLAFGNTSPPDVWVLAVRKTSTCRAKFAPGADPYDRAALNAWSVQVQAHAQIKRAFPR